MPTREEKVLEYIGRYTGTRSAPLRFWRNVKPADTGTMEDLVLEILEKSHQYCSYNTETKRMETIEDCRRSSFDIWRHVRNVRPETTIFEVMRAIYVLGSKDLLVGCYCHNVHRRVFRLRKYHENSYLADVESMDEYRIQFDSWEEIGEEV